VRKHNHSIYSLCHECKSWGVNGVGNTKCGNCGSLDTTTYYPEECLDFMPKYTYVFEEDNNTNKI
jgi:hypothetical protein